jgi:hypothetical protein
MQAKKNNGKTLTLFLVQGDSTGSIQVGIKGDTLKLVSLPKNHLSDYMSESDIGRGFYLLVQQNPNVAQPFSVYVGESKDLLTRMTRHKADTNKEFERIILAYTSDNELNTDHTRYIEETLIKFCKIHPLVDSTNGNNGQASPLQPSDKAYCDNLLEQFVLVLSALGYYFIKDWGLAPSELKARYASMPTVTTSQALATPLILENQTPEESLQEIETLEQQESRKVRNEKISESVKKNGLSYLSNLKLSESVKKTWEDPIVRQKRGEHHAVKVENYGEFSSVADAFRKLDLPMNKHKEFRLKLKAEKTQTFRFEDKEYIFKLIE